MMQKIL